MHSGTIETPKEVEKGGGFSRHFLMGAKKIENTEKKKAEDHYF